MKFDSVPQVCSLCSWHLHRNCLILRRWFCAASSFDVNGLTFKICIKLTRKVSYEMTCRGLQDNQQPHPIPSPVHPIQQRSITKDFLQPQVAMYICMSWQPEKLQNKSSIQTEAVWNISINRSFPKVVRMFAKSSKITTMHHDAACGHLSHPSMVAQWCVCHLVSDSRSNTSFCPATKSAFFSFGSIRPLVFPLWTVGLSHQQIFEYVGDFHQRRSENLNAKTQVKNLQAIVVQIWIVSKIQADGTR